MVSIVFAGGLRLAAWCVLPPLAWPVLAAGGQPAPVALAAAPAVGVADGAAAGHAGRRGLASGQAVPVTAQADPAATPELFVTAEAVPQNPLLQAQVIYTVRLHSRAELVQASMDEPKWPDAVVVRLGDDNGYHQVIDGVDHAVIERRYAVFPQKSGPMLLKPVRVSAEVMALPANAAMRGRLAPVIRSHQAVSNAVTLDVRPPALAAGHWLPAERLALSQRWSTDDRELAVGEPLTRTVTLVAKGIGVGQLPTIGQDGADEGLVVYADPPQVSEQVAGGGLLAGFQQQWTFIANRPGRYVLPKVVVPWFDTQAQKMAVAELPTAKITVVAAAVSPPPPAALPLPTPAWTGHGQLWFWQALSAGLAVGWLVTAGWWRRGTAGRAKAAQPASADSANLDERWLGQLRRACLDNDAAAAKAALLVWGQRQYGAAGLMALADHCEALLRDELGRLNQALYGQAAVDWRGQRLWQAFSEHQARKKIRARRGGDGLRPLYPEG